ncbi:MAG: energy transducer TonB [bacterium]
MRNSRSSHQEEKKRYVKTFELALIFSLIIHLCVLHALPSIDASFWWTKIKVNDVVLEVEDIPKTFQWRKKPPPQNPFVPVPTETEDFPSNETIETVEVEFVDIPEPPPFENGLFEEFIFIPHEEPPVPIGGMRAIHRFLRYPSKALRLGVEGKVVLGLLIDEKGHVVKAQILKHAKFDVGFEEAALKAALKINWKPARQRERAVKVWLALPVRFELVMI